MSKEDQGKLPTSGLTVSTKTPFAWAAHELAVVCDEMDKAERIDAFLDLFDDASLTLGEAVDRRIAVDREFKLKIAAVEEGYRFYRALKDHVEEVHARFKERTKKVIEEADPGVQDAFRGKLGKISLCNSPPAVEYAFGTKEIGFDVVDLFGVDSSYVLSKTTYYIDAARVKAELLAGKALEWASLRTSKHIRFPNAPKKLEGEGA